MRKSILATTLVSILASTTNGIVAFADKENKSENLYLQSRNSTTINKKGKVSNVASNDTLNVRETSSSNSKILFKLKNNTEVTVLSQESNGWYKISYNGNIGFCSNRYITILKEEVSNSSVYKTTASINLRKTASWSGEIVTVAKKDETLNVVNINNSWAKVLYNGMTVYAPSSYLVKVDNNNDDNSNGNNDNNTGNEEIKPTQSNYIVTLDVNLRASASWSADKITVINKNEYVTVIELGDTWTKVIYNGKTGYVPSSYVERINSEDNTPDIEQNPSVPDMEEKPEINEKPDTSDKVEENITVLNRTGKVIKVASNDTLNVREQSNADSKLVFTLKNSTIVNVIGQATNGWYKISYNGQVGFVNNYYIELLTENISTEKYIVTADSNLRFTDSWSSDVITVVNKNEIVDVVSINENWAKVIYKNNNGYLPSSNLTKVNNDNDNNNNTDNDNSNNENNNTETPSKNGQIATIKVSDYLNIRAGAGTNHSVLTQVYNNDIVLIKETNTNGWYKVETVTGIVGWCNSAYLKDIREGTLPSIGSSNELIQNVINVAKAQLGKPYKYGGNGPDSFDCSGLTSYAYKNGANITLPRTSKAQATAGNYVSKSSLKPGDLVFFATSGGSTITHVGIYIGNNEMIHAPSSGKTINIAKITDSYWSSRYVTARRIIN